MPGNQNVNSKRAGSDRVHLNGWQLSVSLKNTILTDAIS